MADEVLGVMARSLYEEYGGVPLGVIATAIRRGMAGKAGVVNGHKLTYPMLCGWVEAELRRVEEYNYNRHQSLK